MNPVVHFEMPYEDRDRMASFYTKAFGWQTQMFGPEMGNYVVATTSESDKETGFPKKVVANSCLECHTAEQSPDFRFARDRHVQGEKDAHPPFQCKLGVF